MAKSLLDNTKTPADLGANIKAERMAQSMTIAELAKAAHVGESTLRTIESGKGNPRLNTVIAIARALGKCRATFGID